MLYTDFLCEKTVAFDALWHNIVYLCTIKKLH